MHNLNLEALESTTEHARQDPTSARQKVEFDGDWQTDDGAVQFRATIPYPEGETVFEADFPPPMGGGGAAPNPLAYCFWRGLACYAMTFAQEAARHGIELRGLHARLTTEVDQTRALGITDNPPVQGIDWTLDVDSDASAAELEGLKRSADEHCSGVWCIENPVSLSTHVSASS